jgi:hypothetical protein
MADRVAGVLTKQGRNIDAITNRSTRPVALLGCWFGENSSLDEASRRDKGGCDVSGNIPHISICRAVGDGLVPPSDKPAFWEWTANTEVVLDTAREWFQTLIAWAEQTLGPTDPDVNLLACCWWNAPAAGAVPEARQYGMADPRTRHLSADYWLSPDLLTLPGGAKYAPNRNNYRRGLAQAETYRVEEPMPPDPMGDPTEAIKQLQVQQQLQSEAIAAILADHYQDGPASAKGLLVQLDPTKFGPLVVVEKQDSK